MSHQHPGFFVCLFVCLFWDRSLLKPGWLQTLISTLTASWVLWLQPYLPFEVANLLGFKGPQFSKYLLNFCYV
jgi:Na+/glutamate symporter